MLLCIFKLYAVPYSFLITTLKGNVIMYFQIICFNVIMGLESELGTLVHDQFLQNSPSKLEQLFETMIVGYTVLKLCLHVSTTSYNNFIDYIWKFQVYCIVALCYICMYICLQVQDLQMLGHAVGVTCHGFSEVWGKRSPPQSNLPCSWQCSNRTDKGICRDRFVPKKGKRITSTNERSYR